MIRFVAFGLAVALLAGLAALWVYLLWGQGWPWWVAPTVGAYLGRAAGAAGRRLWHWSQRDA